MYRSIWIAILAAGFALTPVKPARAFVLSASIGGGGDNSDSFSVFFSLELNAGLRIPLNWWRGDFFFSPELGWSFDLAESHRHQLHTGIACSYSIIDDSLTISYKPAFLTNFNDMGMRNALRIGMFGDIFPLELQHDIIFSSEGTVHVGRVILGIDLAAAFFTLCRIARM